MKNGDIAYLIWNSTKFWNARKSILVGGSDKKGVFTSGRNLADVPAARVSNNVFLL